MIKLGLLTAILPDLTLDEIIDYASSVGLEALEVCAWPKGKATRRYAGVTHLDVDALSYDEMRAYKAKAESKGLEISALAYYPNPLSDNQEEADVAVEHLHKLIDAAAEMGVNMVSTFIGKNKTLPMDDNIALMQKVWTPILKHAEERNVRIAIENCHMLYTMNEWPAGNNLACSPRVWRKMFEMSPNIGLNYDPSHPIVLRMDADAHIREFHDRIFHVHFKDCRLDKDKLDEYGCFDLPSIWHTPKIPGLGDVNFPSFVSTLNQVGYEGAGSIEIEDRAFEGSLENVKRAIETSMRYLRQFI